MVILIQTRNKNLERMLSYSVRDENIRLESVGRSEEIDELGQSDQIITFIIGSDIPDPVQSAQRLHAIKKSAKIIAAGHFTGVLFLADFEGSLSARKTCPLSDARIGPVPGEMDTPVKIARTAAD